MDPRIAEMISSTYLPVVEISEYPAFDHKWDISGAMQIFLNQGLTYMDQGDFDRAVNSFDSLVARSESIAAAFYYRGVCYKVLSNGRPERFDFEGRKAEKDLLRARELAPDATSVMIELAEVYQLCGRNDDAIALYKRVLEIDPQSDYTYYALGNIEVQRSSFVEAKKYYEQSVGARPNARAFVRLAVHSYESSGYVGSAIAYLDKALRVEPRNPRALFWRSLFSYLKGDYRQVLEDLDLLVSLQPNDPFILNKRANINTYLANYDQAFVDFKKLLYGDYRVNKNEYRGKGSFLDLRLDYQYAFEYASKTMYGQSDESILKIKQGFCLMASGQNEIAINELQKLLANGRSPLADFLIALAYEHSAAHDSAFVHYEEAVRYDPDIFDAHKKLGIYRSNYKDWKTALHHFNQMERIEPALIVTYRLRSQIRMNFKDYYGTIIDLTKFIAKDTTDAEVYEMRGFSLYSVQNYKLAVEDYKKAIQLNTMVESRDMSVLRLSANYVKLVESLLQINDTTEALNCIRISEKKARNVPGLAAIKINLLVSQKRFTEARKEVSRLLELKETGLFYSDLSRYRYLAALIEFNAGNLDLSLEHISESLKAKPDNMEALFLQSKIFLRRGQIKRAKKELIKLVEKGHEGSKSLLAQIE